MKTLLKAFAIVTLLVELGLGRCAAQTVQTVDTDPKTGTTTICQGSPNLQYNQKNGNLWGCRPGTGWYLMNTVFSPEQLANTTNIIPLRASLDGAQTTPTTIVFIGDSITQGTGATSFLTSWTPEVTKALHQAYGNGQPQPTGFCSGADSTANPSGCLITLSGSWNGIQGFGPSQSVSPVIAEVQSNGSGGTATTIFPAGNDTIVLYCGEYIDSAAGFTVTIDGNSVASACAATQPSYTMESISYTGLNPLIPHTIVATAPNSGNGYLFGYQAYLSTGGVTMMNVGFSGAKSTYIGTAAQVAWLSTVPNLGGIFVGIGLNDHDLTGATTVANLAALTNEAKLLNVPLVYVFVENDSSNTITAMEPAVKAWAATNNFSWVSVADFWGLFANAPTSLYNQSNLPHPSQTGHNDIANLVLNQLRLTPPLAANAAPLFQRTLFEAQPTSDLICAHAGDTTINSLTCSNSADAAGVYQNFVTYWPQPKNFWAANRTIQICGNFELWTTGTTPTYLMQLFNGGIQLYAPVGSAAAGGARTANGFSVCYQMYSTDTGAHVYTQPIGLGSIPGNTNIGQYANVIAQPKNFGTNALAISIGVQFSATGLASGTYTSGITATGTVGQTCTLTTFNNGNSGGTATVALTGTNTIAGGTALVITNTGNSSTSAATSATAGNGTATCSGTPTVATVLGGAQGNGVWLQSLTVTQVN